MFLIRLIYIKNFSKSKELNYKNEKNIFIQSKTNIKEDNKSVKQIKKIAQQEISLEEDKDETSNKNKIETFEKLIELCNKNKEVKLKYELENNVNLVSFSHGLIEIAFNDNLEKNFIKNLTNKLYIWTKTRWIISFTKEKGEPTIKEKKKIIKNISFEEIKKGQLYNEVKNSYPDAELIDIIEKKKYD